MCVFSWLCLQAVITRLDLVWQGLDLDDAGTFAYSSWRSFIFLLIRGGPIE